MKIQNFEDIVAWQKARVLANLIYNLMGLNKDYGFKDQIQRAVISIMNNIAEGFERKGDKEFKHFLFIAKGSCAEVRSMTYIARDLKYLSINDSDKINSATIEISKILSGLIKTL